MGYIEKIRMQECVKVPLKPITPAPECEYQLGEMQGIPWCYHAWCPCDKTDSCDYQARTGVRRQRVTVEDRLEAME